MYEEYWKLKEKPFDNNHDLRFLYLSLQHEEAVTRLIYAVRDRRHGVLLSGQYGSGKSIILHYLLQQIRDMGGHRIVQIGDPMMSMAEFYREFLAQLGTTEFDPSSRPSLANALQQTLVSIHDKGEHTVIAIDEADLIKEGTMQEMRLLLDLCHPQDQSALLTLVLCGCLGGGTDNPGHLQSPALRQRIPIRCLIDNLDASQCAEYIHHRLEIAGQANPLFTEEAIQMIAEASGGAPRVINNICDLSLFLGSSRNMPKVDADVVGAVIQEISGSLE